MTFDKGTFGKVIKFNNKNFLILSTMSWLLPNNYTIFSESIWSFISKASVTVVDSFYSLEAGYVVLEWFPINLFVLSLTKSFYFFSWTLYKELKKFQTRILVATNLFVRVCIVFDYDMPEDEDTYLHRICEERKFVFIYSNIEF